MDGLDLIASLTPGPPDFQIDWEAVERSALALYAKDMAATPQNPVYHGEGDVWIHTRNVCGELVRLQYYRDQPERIRRVLFAAALLHDVGKTRTTRLEDGRWTSPNHASVGAGMARELLWTRIMLCGTPEKLAFREAVCALVRRHSFPAMGVLSENAPRRLRAISQIGLLAPDFTLERLCALSEADARGRVCGDLPEMLDAIALCAEIAGEEGCLTAPYPFPDGHTRFLYLTGRDVPPDYPRFDDCWGPVTMLSGLPGAGKDTWIRENLPGVPVVSLDDIRRELRIAPTANQGPVAEEAKRRARELLRQRRPFVWNATCVTEEARRRPLELFHAYGAWTRIVYLETDLNENLRRNASRPNRVPEDVIFGLIAKLTPPAPDEAREVRWIPL